MDDFDEDLKLILLGESGVGKTRLINDFFGLKEDSKERFDQFHKGEIEINPYIYKYYFWDSAGNQMYRKFNKILFRDAKILLIVYSIEYRESFEEVDFWIKYVKENIIHDKYIIALVANKSDLFEEQKVSEEEGQEAAKKYGIDFLTTSAETDIESFKEFVNNLIIKYIKKYKIKKNSEKINKKINEDKISFKINKKAKDDTYNKETSSKSKFLKTNFKHLNKYMNF